MIDRAHSFRPLRLLVPALLAAALAAPLASTAAMAQYSDEYRDDYRNDRRYDDRGYDDRRYDDRRYDDRGGYDDYRGSQDAYREGYRDGYRQGDASDDYDDYDGDGDNVDVSFFHDELVDHGRWITTANYGYVWQPRGIDSEWRPYSRGHWVNTDEYGWYWVSDEPFGWATYHYGRWYHDDRNGWLWVPGSTWGPAWVSWRRSDTYVGWAPLPPEARWSRRYGVRFTSSDFDGPRFAFYWNFIEPQYITTPGVYRYCAPRHRARTIIYRTTSVTQYSYTSTRIVNRGISVSYFNTRVATPIRSVRVYTTTSRYARGRDRVTTTAVRVWRPDLRQMTTRTTRTVVRTNVARPSGGFWGNVDGKRTRPPALRKTVAHPPSKTRPVPGFTRNNPNVGAPRPFGINVPGARPPPNAPKTPRYTQPPVKHVAPPRPYAGVPNPGNARAIERLQKRVAPNQPPRPPHANVPANVQRQRAIERLQKRVDPKAAQAVKARKPGEPAAPGQPPRPPAAPFGVQVR